MSHKMKPAVFSCLVLCVVMTQLKVYVDALLSTGNHVCSYTCSTPYSVRQRYHSKCGLFGWKRCTRHRTVTAYRRGTCYRCCSGWATRDNRHCSAALCHGQAMGTCLNGGTCTAPNRCACRPGFNSPTCSGNNFCTYVTSETFTKRQRYTTKCGLFNWKRCTRHRTVSATRTVSKRRCCSGWHNSGSLQCVIAQCYGLPIGTCPNRGTCLQPNQCACRRGFGKPRCADINECSTKNGGCAQACTNTVGSFRCSCNRGYVLHRDQRTCSDINECLVNNGGCVQRCRNTRGSFTCYCYPGYTLNRDRRTCTDVDECLTIRPCNHICQNFVGSFKCTCNTGYSLQSDRTSCRDNNECNTLNGGCGHTCSNTPGSFNCGCRRGYALENNARSCRDINECSMNHGRCAHICRNSAGSFSCHCRTGYFLQTDDRSCSDQDECLIANGGCSDQCRNLNPGFECYCDNGYELMSNKKTCTDINECLGRSHGCSDLCINDGGSFHCDCPAGYELQANHKTCSDKNECHTNNGGCSHTCLNNVGTFTCTCPSLTHSLGPDKRTCQLLSNLASCLPQPDGSCVCPTNLHLLPDNVHCSDSCFMGPCEHGGTCSVSGADYTCDCTGTGYSGLDCESGVMTLSTNTVTVDIGEQSIPVLVFAKPETELILTGSSIGTVVNMLPNPVILRTPDTQSNFVIVGTKRGVHNLHLTPSGLDGSAFTPEDIAVTVQDVFSKLSPGGFRLPRGCFFLGLFTCPQPGQVEVVFSSTSPWYQLNANSNIKFTFGITFIEVNSLSLPVSLTGLEIQVTPAANKFILGPVNSIRSPSDGTQLSDRRDNGCIALPITSKDIQTFVNDLIFLKDLIQSIYNKLPPWLRLTPSPTPYIQTSSLWSRILSGRKVQQIPSCRGGPLYDDVIYQVFRFSQGTQLSVLGSEVTLPHVSAGNEYCLIIDLCHDYGTTLILMLPPDASAALQNLDVFAALKNNTGIEIIPVGIGLSIPRHLNVARSITQLEFWNGDEMFNYAVMPSSNIWVSGSIRKEIDNTKGFDYACSGNTQLHIRLPNLNKFFNGILLDEWNILIQHSSSFSAQVRFQVFGKWYTLRFAKFVQASAYGYVSLGGDQPRVWCGPNANPPGAFVMFAVDARMFRGIPILENIVFSTDVAAYGFLTFDELDNVAGISPRQIYEQILRKLKDKVEKAWTFIQTEIAKIINSLTKLVKEVIQKLKDLWNNFRVLVQQAIADLINGQLPSLASILGDVASMYTQIKAMFDQVKSTALMIFDTVVTDFVAFIEQCLEEIKDFIKDLIDNVRSDAHKLIAGDTSFGIKGQMAITIFSIKFPRIAGEFVYSDKHLARCTKFQYAYKELQGEGAFRIYGEVILSTKMFTFFYVEKGYGLEFALAKQSRKWVVRFHTRWSFFGLRISADIFITTRGLYGKAMGKIFNVFRASLEVTADVAVPASQLRLRVAGELLAGGDSSFDGSFLDALRELAKKLADGANDRISKAQDALTSAQGKLSNAQNWLEKKKTNVDKANVVFDKGIAALEKAKQKLEAAKGPFLKADAKLKAAQQKVDKLCKIKTCNKICIPGIKCKICYKKVWFAKVPYPCCKWTSCMIKLPNLLCEARNLACRAVRGLAYAALAIARAVVRLPLIALDLAKALLSVAQVVVDKARVVLDIVKLAFTFAQVLLEGAKKFLDAAKGILEAVKFAVRAAFWVFNFIVKYGLQNIIDIKNCGFAVEISVANWFEFEVYCDINLFNLGWSTIRFKMNFRKIIQSLWNAAKSIVGNALKKIVNAIFGRKKREIGFVEYEVFKRMNKLYRVLRDEGPTAPDPTENPPENITLGTNTEESFAENCAEFRPLHEYLFEVADMLGNISETILEQLENLRNASEASFPDTSQLNETRTPEGAGINITEALISFNLTEVQIRAVLDQSDFEQSDLYLAILSVYESHQNQTRDQIEIVENFNILEVWRANLLNFTAESFSEDLCSGFEDCVMHTVTQLQILYDPIDIPVVGDIKMRHLPALQTIILELISIDSLDATSALVASQKLKEILAQLDGETVFCGSAPVFVIQPVDVRALKGHSATFHCEASGVPNPVYQWYKGINDNLIISTSTTLILENVEKDDEGTYTCRASNHIGIIEASDELLVEYGPTVTSDFENRLDLILGESLQLICNADASPEATFVWHSSAAITPLIVGAELNISIASVAMSGLYKCEALNKHGIDTSTEISIQVYEGNVACPSVSLTAGFGLILYGNQTLFSEIPGDLGTRFTYSINGIFSTNASSVIITELTVDSASNKLNIVLKHQCPDTFELDGDMAPDEFQQQADGLQAGIDVLMSVAENHDSENTAMFQQAGNAYLLNSATFDVDTTEATCPPGTHLSISRDKLCLSDTPDVTVSAPINLALTSFDLTWDPPLQGSAFVEDYEITSSDTTPGGSSITLTTSKTAVSLMQMRLSSQITIQVRARTETSIGPWASITAEITDPVFRYCIDGQEEVPGCQACVTDEFIVHPTDCSRYYQCVPAEKAKQRRCFPTILRFNLAKGRCDWPWMVMCLFN